jgi:hypothetical protein
MRGSVSNPSKGIDKIKCYVGILIFMLLDNREEGKRFRIER